MGSLKPLAAMARRSDEELLQTELVTYRPDEQEGLVERLPPDAVLRRIVNTYEDPRWPKHKVQCAQCGRRAHSRGFTAELADGHLALLGSTCGAEAFGDTWEVFAHQLTGERKRKDALLRGIRLRKFLPLAISALASWKNPLVQVGTFQRRWRAVDDEMFSRLQAFAYRGDGTISVDRRGEVDGKVRRYSDAVGRLAGREFFKDSDWPRSLLEQATDLLEDALVAADNPSPPAMREAADKVRRANGLLGRAADVVSDAIEAMRPANLALIAEYAAVAGLGEYRVVGDVLYRDLPGDDRHDELRLPDGLRALPKTPLDFLRQALEGGSLQ